LKKHYYRLKNQININRNLIKNFTNLSVLYIFNLFIPFIIFPYLIRVLGAETYGLVIYAQAVVMYFSILIGFGFNLSGVKIISSYRDNKEKLSEVISSILIIKFCLFLISLIIIIGVLFILSVAEDNKILFILSMSAVLSELLFPIWYFQGIEEMSYWTKITLVSRLVYLGLIFLLVHSPADYLYVPIAIGIGHMLAGLMAFYILLFKHNIKFRFQSFKKLKFYFLDSLPLFLSGLSVNIISSNNKFIIGTFIGMQEVSFYELADKIRTLFKLPQTVLNLTIYPKVSREKNILFIKNMFKLTFLINLILVTVVLLSSEYIITVFAGSEMLQSVSLVKFLIFSILLLAMKDVFGVQILIPNGYNRVFTKIILKSIFVYIIQIMLIWFTSGFSSLNIITATLITELFMVVYMFYYCKKLMLWK
jgi:O-antigen/teichoic acid export membrane protein